MREINAYFEKQRGISGGYPKAMRYTVSKKAAGGYQICIEHAGETASDIWKLADPWGFAAFDFVRNEKKIGPALDHLRFVMPTSSDAGRPKCEAFKRRLSYLAENNKNFSITLVVGGREEPLYTMSELAERPQEEIVRPDFSRRGDNDSPGRLEKDFQVFLFGKGLYKDDAEEVLRTNERLSLFGKDFFGKNAPVEREFPTGVFEKVISQDTRVLPAEFIDFVTINKNGELAIVELKFNDASLEVMAQLLNYVLFFYSYQQKLAPQLDKRFQCDSAKAKIKGYLVSNVFHSRFNAVWRYYSRGKILPMRQVVMGYMPDNE